MKPLALIINHTGVEIPLKNPSSSSTQTLGDTGGPPAFAVDRDSGTFVYTDSLSQQWFAADFGQNMIVNSISVNSLGASYFGTTTDVIEIAVKLVKVF